MKQKYLKYYERYSSLAHFVFLFDALRARSRVEKLSLIARQRDYLGLGGRPGLLALHRDLNRYLLEAAKTWDASMARSADRVRTAPTTRSRHGRKGEAD